LGFVNEKIPLFSNGMKKGCLIGENAAMKPL